MPDSDIDILLPPLLPVTDDDHGAYVILASSLLIILTFLVVSVAFVSRLKIVGGLLISDWLICLATIFFFIEAICMKYACSNGLGRHRETMDNSFEQYSKDFYASQILTHLSLTCAKLSTVFLIISIKPFRSILLASYATLTAICLWCICGLFSLAFQCEQPRPWDFTPGRCVNQQALHLGLGVGSIVTDLAIIILPCLMISKVQLSLQKRLTISTLFSTRIIVVIFTAILLSKTNPMFHSNAIDQPWQAVEPSIWTQSLISLSIVTACIPGLKRFLSDLQTGLMAGAITEFYELSVSGGAGRSYASGTHESGRGTGVQREYEYQVKEPFRPADGHGLNNTIRGPPKFSKERRKTELMNRVNKELKSDSSENLTESNIVQIREYEVRFEGRPISAKEGDCSPFSIERTKSQNTLSF